MEFPGRARNAKRFSQRPFKRWTLVLGALIALALSQIFGGNGTGSAYASYEDSSSAYASYEDSSGVNEITEPVVESSPPPPLDENEPHQQSSEEALAQDLALVAEANGWTVGEAALNRKMADAVGDVADQVAERFPEIFIGSAVAEDPYGAPTMFVKGSAPAEVRQLVAEAEVEVNLVDGQPYSFQELEERTQRLHEALLDQGFKEVVITADILEEGQLEATVRRESGAPRSADEVTKALPAELRGAEITVADHALVRTNSAAYGGMYVTENSNKSGHDCTSGWSVAAESDGTQHGVTMAGHCYNIDFIHHGSTTHSLTHQREHIGQWGDVEWKKSNTAEPAKFYASSSSVRDVDEVEARSNISVNETICVYGRVSDDRDCNTKVKRVSTSLCDNGSGQNRVVLMDGLTVTTYGDSGGGWSWNNRAYGNHIGACYVDGAWREHFSVADLYDEALGVCVRTTGGRSNCSPTYPSTGGGGK